MADLQDIINTLIAEAAGEGPEGMRRVGETILNRSAIRGISPAEVVRQPYQYTGFSNPGPAAVAAQRNPNVISAAEAAWALAQQPGDPTNGADHYHTNYVSPSWANTMPTTGTYGDHIFYRSRSVPADALAALLTPRTREVALPRARPTVREDIPMPRPRPQSPGDLMAAMFGASFSAPRDAATGRGLDQHLARQTQAGGNLTMPGQIDRSVSSLNQESGLAEALAAMVAPRSVPAMPTGVKQSYAAQEGAVSRSAITAASAKKAADQLMLRNANQQAADAERNRTVVASIPTKVATGTTVATIPTSPRPQSYAGQEGTKKPASPTSPTSRINNVDVMPGFSDLASVFGTRIPTASSSVNNGKDQSRLPANAAAIDRPNSGVSQAHGLGGQTSLPLAGGGSVPLPKPRPSPDSSVSIVDRNTAPQFTTVTEQVINPEWEAAQAAKIDPIGTMPTWDAFSNTFAPKKEPPKYITVTKQVPVKPTPVAKPAPVPKPVPAQRPATQQASSPLHIVVQRDRPIPQSMTKVDQLRAMGYSPAAAYEAANAAARGGPSVEDRVTGRSNGSDGTAQSISG